MVPRYGMAATALAGAFFAAVAGAAEPPTEAAKKAEAEARQQEAQKQEAQKREELRKRTEENRALQAELQKVVVTDLDPAADGPPPQGDQKATQVWARKQHIRATAMNFERQALGSLEGELELIRQTCGSLAPELRRRALEAGMLAIRKTALEAANAQFAGRQPGGVMADDAGIEAVRAVLAAGGAREELAAYEAERRSRAARRRERAQVMTVTFLDAELELSADQRTTITAALAKAWQDPWTDVVAMMGMHNGHFAPDHAADCIVPHLTPRQLAAWKTWCGQRSMKATLAQNPQFGRQQGRMWQQQLGAIGLQVDDWWRE